MKYEENEMQVCKPLNEVLLSCAEDALQDDCYDLEEEFDAAALVATVADIAAQVMKVPAKLNVVDTCLPNGKGTVYGIRLVNHRIDAAVSFLSLSHPHKGTALSEPGYAYWQTGYGDAYELCQRILQDLDQALYTLNND